MQKDVGEWIENFSAWQGFYSWCADWCFPVRSTARKISATIASRVATVMAKPTVATNRSMAVAANCGDVCMERWSATEWADHSGSMAFRDNDIVEALRAVIPTS